MTSILNETAIPWRERIRLASEDEPTARIHRRIIEALEFAEVNETTKDEILAYIDLLGERHNRIVDAVMAGR